MVDSRSYWSVIDSASALDVYGTDMPSRPSSYVGGVWRNVDMWGDTDRYGDQQMDQDVLLVSYLHTCLPLV